MKDQQSVAISLPTYQRLQELFNHDETAINKFVAEIVNRCTSRGIESGLNCYRRKTQLALIAQEISLQWAESLIRGTNFKGGDLL